ncbi:UDP-glycosyltransferase 83A1 [Cajanus cajan]|uniref:Glycosyltransferase n=1 Tax=Cajanus cajan TaxID=3821 RepID=A0A151SCR4_CAJCA|nr:UDP-glycosyltransferase 83A1 [Cajanus cajan]KYP52551.1 Cytokinin-O-glucosyltransferase 2 [Cajanus cajan]
MNIPTVLALPYPAQGHVNPMMTLSQKLVEHGCKVLFLNTDFNHKRMLSSVVELQEGLDDESLLKLVSIPDGLGPDDDRNDQRKLCETIPRTMPAALEKFIEDIHVKGDHRISFIVADLCMAWALDVGAKLGIKGAVLCPGSATLFALLYNVPRLIHHGIIDSDYGLALTTKKTMRISPSMPEMDTRDFFWLNMGDPIIGNTVVDYLVHCTRSLHLTEWWLCNTTHELEPGTLSYIPKILPIGPLLRSHDNTSASATTKPMGMFWEEDLSCMSWLDQQPHRSVLYVAFGSFTLFNQTQFNELALGLDLTNRPFLWVVRQDNKMVYPNEFLGSKGKIVRWAPQQKVLSHPSIACFVTHCGWNSIMEGLSNGVPLLCWPYFADQLHNKTHICDELKVGLGFDSNENGLVSCKELKMKVDQLLNDDNIKSRSLGLKEKVVNSITKGGRSLENLNRFVKWLKE